MEVTVSITADKVIIFPREIGGDGLYASGTELLADEALSEFDIIDLAADPIQRQERKTIRICTE